MNFLLLKKLFLFFLGLAVIGLASVFIGYKYVESTLPEINTLKDYKPLLVSQVYDRNNKKVGEYFRGEKRILIPYEKIPKNLIYAFMAAEDDKFFEHHGINFQAILRAAIANMQAGRSVQGGSTITQQVVKTLLLTDERTLIRKIREAILSWKIEESLSKEDIMYLYLNQIFFGQRASGIEAAAETYFRKSATKLKLSEMAILAGLPQAPSRYSPVINPTRSKERQVYVLRRMASLGYISKEESEKAIHEPVKVFVSERYSEMAPFYIETLRQILVAQLGEKAVLDEGIKIHTSLDLEKQIAAQKAIENGLRDLDKRQGFRGPLKKLTTSQEVQKHIAEHRKNLISASTPERTILPTGEFAEIYLPNIGRRNKLLGKIAAPQAEQAVKIPPYISVGQIVEGVVTEINDVRGFVLVQAPEMLGAIDFQTMKWARKPNFEKSYEQDTIRKPSDALKVGDVILVKVINDQFQLSDVSKNKKDKPMTFPGRVTLNLEQEPKVEGALVSFDLKTQELLALVGGFDFQRNEFNRALQAARQTGSSFKALVYAAALDHGYTASTPIMDTPIVFEQKEIDEGQEATKLWRPSNHGRDYSGDITFRNALVRSLNIPTVKIIEDIGVKYSTDYARRLGIFSSLNQDFTMSLGTSSVTLYEMTKAFSVFGRLGKRIKPIIIHKVIDQNNKQILGETSLDIRYKNEIDPIEEEFVTRRKSFFESMSNGASDETVNENSQSDGKTSVETKKPIKDEMFFLPDEEQAIKPQTAYLITSLLKGAVEDPHGTGGKARALGREVAGKTGTSQGYFDAWFLGYTAQISTGVWVGFDKEHTIGRGEVGGRSALPIWVEYMQEAHKKLPIANIPVPDGITFVSIDADTGKLASSKSKNVIKQAFLEGTEPNLLNNKEEETSDFLKQDLTE